MSELTADDLELTIDEEFAGCVPRHTDNESEELRKAVEIEGRFHYPILYWRNNGDNIIVDGRHRFELWCSLPENTPIPPPELKEVFYPDRAAVRRVIMRDRLGRSNMDDTTRKLLIGRLYNEEKRAPSENLKSGENPGDSPDAQQVRIGDENEPSEPDSSVTTAERIGEETGLSARTVQKYGELAEALDRIGEVNGKAKLDIESGALSVKDKDVIAIGKLELKTQIATALKNLRNGQDWTTGLSIPKPKRARVKKAKAPKPRKKKPASALKELSTAVGTVSRALVKAGKDHGEGAQYKAIFDALTGIKKLIAEWKP